jgi:hypothetical protein
MAKLGPDCKGVVVLWQIGIGPITIPFRGVPDHILSTDNSAFFVTSADTPVALGSLEKVLHAMPTHRLALPRPRRNATAPASPANRRAQAFAIVALVAHDRFAA